MNPQVMDTRPAGARVDFNDVSSVEKYTMPTTDYESRTDSVLAWKKAQKLGRFDPSAPDLEQQRINALQREAEERGEPPLPNCETIKHPEAETKQVSLSINAVVSSHHPLTTDEAPSATLAMSPRSPA